MLKKSPFVVFVAGLFLLLHLTTDAGEVRPEWAKIVQAAKKEGEVTVYTDASFEPLFQEFHKKFPEIRVTSVTPERCGGQRIMAERRAEKYLADLYVCGAGTAHDILLKAKALEPLKPFLLLPEVADESKWWRGRHQYIDKEGGYILAFNGLAQAYFHYNTKLVNPEEFRSYWDFLQPKWRGKIVISDPTMGGGVTGALRFFYWTPELGPEFLRRFLAEMEATAARDMRQLVDWLAAGKFVIAALTPADRADIPEAKKQGLPVDWFDSKRFKEGAPISSSSGNVAFLNKAPHPNAATVALNWLLSREGQLAYQRIVGGDSLRIDIPKDDVPSHARRVEGAKYEVMDNPEWRDMSPVLKIVQEAWKKKD